MKMKTNHAKKARKPGSLYSFMIRGLVFLVAVMVLLGLLLVFFSVHITDYILNGIGTGSFMKQLPLLKAEQYDEVAAQRYLGKNGYFEVLDDEAHVIYCSRKDKKNTYSVDSLQYLTDYQKGVRYIIESLETGGKANGYVLSCYKNNGSDWILQGIAVIDSQRYIVYTNLELSGSRVSKKTINRLFTSSLDESGRMVLEKTTYTDNDGNTRYLLIHAESTQYVYDNLSEKVTIILIFVFAGCVILLIILVGLRMVAKMRRPLVVLDEAMKGFSEGKREPVRDYKGPREFVQIIDTFNDMSDKLTKSEMEQRRLEEQKRKMLADISHDLKTPITVISGYARAIEDGLIPKEDEEKYVRIISQKADLLEELISSFSDYSRLDHPDFQLTLEKGDLCEYFRSYMAGRYQELQLDGFGMEVDIPDERIEAVFDRMQLKRVFENIITNSVRHAGAGATIYGSIRVESRQAVIELGDNGAGIPEEFRDHIFEPFVIGDESRKSGGGSGLGLSIAKKIVERHGGTIELIEPEKGRTGTWFRICLPLR